MPSLIHVRSLAIAFGLLFAFRSPGSFAHATSDAVVKDLLTEAIAEYPGHELNMITVTYPPGGSSKPHRHDAYVLVYVLKGAVEMKVKGAPLRRLEAGETFVERPADIHEISRNASSEHPATFLVVALKETSRPLTVPAPVTAP